MMPESNETQTASKFDPFSPILSEQYLVPEWNNEGVEDEKESLSMLANGNGEREMDNFYIE